jgi:ATP-dependent DNA helicase PIF1
MIRENLHVAQEYALQCYESGENIFLTGPGGTGKTSLIRLMVECTPPTKKVQVCAMTGCAAILLNCHARTLHSWSGLKIPKGEMTQIVTNIKNDKKACKTWKTTDILILDEVSMLSCQLLEILNAVAKTVRNSEKPFGGMQLVFSGDFFQLPPIQTMQDANTKSSSGQFCFESPVWDELFSLDNHIELTHLFRQKDPLYKKVLNHIRKGVIDQEDYDLLTSRLHVKYVPEEHNNVVPTKLYATNARVVEINKREFELLTTPCFEYHIVQDENYIPGGLQAAVQQQLYKKQKLSKAKVEMEFRYLIDNSPIERILYLKKGANVMCTVNIDVESGICNGALGKIDHFVHTSDCGPPMPVVLFENGQYYKFSVKYWQSDDYPYLAIGQIPLKLAWAMTIHKSQGATLPMGEIDIGNSIFECGQTYVALSRIQSLSGLYLCAFNPHKIKINKKVQEFYAKIPEVEFEVEYETIEKEELVETVEENIKTISVNI